MNCFKGEDSSCEATSRPPRNTNIRPFVRRRRPGHHSIISRIQPPSREAEYRDRRSRPAMPRPMSQPVDSNQPVPSGRRDESSGTSHTHVPDDPPTLEEAEVANSSRPQRSWLSYVARMRRGVVVRVRGWFNRIRRRTPLSANNNPSREHGAGDGGERNKAHPTPSPPPASMAAGDNGVSSGLPQDNMNTAPGAPESSPHSTRRNDGDESNTVEDPQTDKETDRGGRRSYNELLADSPDSVPGQPPITSPAPTMQYQILNNDDGFNNLEGHTRRISPPPSVHSFSTDRLRPESLSSTAAMERVESSIVLPEQQLANGISESASSWGGEFSEGGQENDDNDNGDFHTHHQQPQQNGNDDENGETGTDTPTQAQSHA